jgi:ATP-dependent helicase/nuclease subunit A
LARYTLLPIAALILEALRRTVYDAALLGEFLGERKLANLRKLIAQARAFDRAGVLGLTDFIVQLSQFVARQPREPLAATHPEATDVVRLMTIHQAKGLEFPVVFVPDLGRQTNNQSDNADYCDELGPLVRLPSEHEDTAVMNGQKLHAMACEAEDRQEAIRLFYVATTRAADFLVLSSGMKNLDRACGVWLPLLAERFDLAAGRLTARLPAGFSTPQVRVITQPPEVGAKRSTSGRRIDLARVIQEMEQATAAGDGRTLPAVQPIPRDAAARRSFSISRIQGALEERPPPGAEDETCTLSRWTNISRAATPGGSQSVDGALLGSLVHAVLATLNLSGLPGNLARHVAAHADKLRISDEQLRALALRLVEKLLESPRTRQLRQARRMFREVEFVLAWPPVQVGASIGPARSSANADDDAPRHLQGFIDCLYQDSDGRWHVLNYKTNQVSASNLPSLVAQYEMQLMAYGLAAEHALREPVVELALHFLRSGQEHTYKWNDRARGRAVQLLGEAIEKQCGETRPIER